MSDSPWRVKKPDKEHTVPDLDTLRQWAAERRFLPSDFVYNPTLGRWIYARDVAELEDVFASDPVPVPAAETVETKPAKKKTKAGLPPLFGVLPGLAMTVFGLATLIPAHGITSPQAAWGASTLGIGLVMIGPLWRRCTGAIPSTLGRRALRASLIIALLVGISAGISAEDRLARSQGWADYAAKSEARRVGASTPAELLAHQQREAKADRQRRIDAGSAERKRQNRETAACRNDLQCWGDKHSVSAIVYCQDRIERLAQYAHEWTDGILEPKFSRFRWKNQAAGHVTYIGDKLRFQNGFGAWRPMVYECDFDPSNDRVLDVRASAGRLPAR